MAGIGYLLEILRKLESAEMECVSLIGYLQGLGGCKKEDFNAQIHGTRELFRKKRLVA